MVGFAVPLTGSTIFVRFPMVSYSYFVSLPRWSVSPARFRNTVQARFAVFPYGSLSS